jgi:hypothetical protein
VVCNNSGIGLGWVYLFMGIMIGSAVFPIWCCLTWSKATANAAFISIFAGQASAIITWLVTAKSLYGKVNVTTLGMNYPMLTGNLFALFFSSFIMVAVSLWKPDNYDFDEMNTKITLVEKDEKSGLADSLYDRATLDKCLKWIVRWGFGFSVLIIIVWPALTVPVGVFPVGYFGWWIAVAMMWALLAAAVVIGLPLFESREALLNVAVGVYDDVAGDGFKGIEAAKARKQPQKADIELGLSGITTLAGLNSEIELLEAKLAYLRAAKSNKEAMPKGDEAGGIKLIASNLSEEEFSRLKTNLALAS